MRLARLEDAAVRTNVDRPLASSINAESDPVTPELAWGARAAPTALLAHPRRSLRPLAVTRRIDGQTEHAPPVHRRSSAARPRSWSSDAA